VSFTIIWQYIHTYKYFHFGYYDWDLALYSQVMWNLVHGSLDSSLFDTNFLTNHAQYITFLLAPIYFLFQHPLTLIFLKIFSYAIGAFVLYKIAKKSLEPIFATILMILYLICPANVFGILYEFHFESLAIALIFMLYYSFQTQKYRSFCFIAFFLALIKENMPLIIIAFGIYEFFSKKHRNKLLWAAMPIMFGALVFYVSMFVITPHLRADFSSKNQYLGMYASLGSSPLDILSTFLTDPGEVLKIIFTSENIFYARELFNPLLFLPLFSPHILFLGSPIFLQNLLSSTRTQHSIYFHYASTLMPFIFLASIGPLTFIKSKLRRPFFYVIILSLLLVNSAFWYRLENELNRRIINLDRNESTAVWQMIAQIPSESGVIATLGFLDQLSQRKGLQSFLDVTRNKSVFSGKPFKLSDSTQYALINFRDMWLLDRIRNSPETVSKNLRKVYFGTQWNVINAYNEIVLLKRNQEIGVKLVQRSSQSFIPVVPEKMVMIDDTFALLDVQFDKNHFRQESMLSLIFYWKSINLTNSIYKVQIGIQNDHNIIRYQRRIGSIFDPTSGWQDGDYIEDRYWISISDLKPGQYSLYFSVYESQSNVAASLKLKSHTTKDKITKIKFAEITIPAEKG